jgi:AcrR family transcriptional regulator
MDEIAAIASASKQTLYKHFSDKRRLFEQVITDDIDRAEDRSEPRAAARRRPTHGGSALQLAGLVDTPDQGDVLRQR